MLNTKLLGSVSSPPAVYVDDVFQTFLYTGNSSTQTITNGIDLAGKGGLVWVKQRGPAGNNHQLADTVRGASSQLASNTTAAATSETNRFTSFNSDGFSLDSGTIVNNSTQTYCSWTFREQAKFFDVVTFTATGSSQVITHNLGSTPGMIFFKRTDGASNWLVWHRSLAAQHYLKLNATDASADLGGVWCTPTSTNTTVDIVFGAGQTWVAYFYAHDAGGFGAAGTDNVISCGSYTGTGASQNISLGYEPQYVLIKNATTAGYDWYQFDIMKGMSNTDTAFLSPNTSSAENYYGPNDPRVVPNATGFNIVGSTAFNFSGDTYIYMAIRRPMKPPTSGTQVFSPIISSASVNTKLTTGFPVDSQWGGLRNGDSDNFQVIDRLRNISTNATETSGNIFRTSGNNAENTGATARSNFWDNTGFRMFSWWEGGNTVFYNFRRATGFMDVVCFTGSGTATTQAHNLGVAPELMIVKRRNTLDNWTTYSQALGNTSRIFLNSSNAVSTGQTTTWNSTSPTNSVFSLGTNTGVNASGSTYVAYLFATLTGISKVGSYTGNGSSQTINCGFTAGARFVMIKRTDSTGNWCVFDTARGIVSGNDPQLRLNDALSGVGEINEDALDPANSGFIINETTESLNASGGTYIYLAIA